MGRYFDGGTPIHVARRVPSCICGIPETRWVRGSSVQQLASCAAVGVLRMGLAWGPVVGPWVVRRFRRLPCTIPYGDGLGGAEVRERAKDATGQHRAVVDNRSRRQTGIGDAQPLRDMQTEVCRRTSPSLQYLKLVRMACAAWRFSTRFARSCAPARLLALGGEGAGGPLPRRPGRVVGVARARGSGDLLPVRARIDRA